MSEKITRLKNEYVRVNCYAKWLSKTMPDGRSFGGNQGWFRGEGKNVIAPLGCGLISCADILLYKSGRTKLDRDEYMEFVHSLNRRSLTVRRKLGLNGFSMAFGMRSKLRGIGLRLRPSWCFSKKKMLTRIISMLENDIPVTIAVGPYIALRKSRRKDSGVNFWVRDKQGALTLPAWRSGLVKDHYVTVTAVIETEDKTLLEISSWGEKYYIDWQEYLGYINRRGTFFSNIMYIR